MGPPTIDDWAWGSDGTVGAIAQALIALPAGAIGWQLEARLNAAPFAFADQNDAGITDLFFSGPASAGDDVDGQVRWIISGAGFGDPSTVYSDFSEVKTFKQ